MVVARPFSAQGLGVGQALIDGVQVEQPIFNEPIEPANKYIKIAKETVTVLDHN